MNILVTGSRGQLGSEMRIVSRESKDKYFFTDIEELDICDSHAVEDIVAKESIDIVINCAAYTNVDKAEDEENKAETLNSDAVRNLATAMKVRNGLLVHISTDYVFGGNSYNTPIKEEEKENPLGAYGRTKLHGEEVVKDSGCKYIIIRTAWLYSEYGKNFVKTMLNLTSTKSSIKVVFDQVGTPTYALDLAKCIFNIVEKRLYEGHYGIYNFTNEGVCSWFDFAKMIAKIANNNMCDIQPCHSEEFPSKVKRPSYSVLDKTKIKNTFNIKIPYWTDSLVQCINTMRNL